MALKSANTSQRADRNRTLLLACLSLLFAGCGSSSVDQAIDRQLKEVHGARVQLAKFAGRVMVDGQAPTLGPKEALFVMLYDPNYPPGPGESPFHTPCDKEGNFEFTRFSRGDGVPLGSYVVLFAQLKAHGSQRGNYGPPDKLKNLYSDPDTSQFKVDVTSPGKTDYLFDLQVEGKEPVAKPGPHAVTQIRR